MIKINKMITVEKIVVTFSIIISLLLWYSLTVLLETEYSAYYYSLFLYYVEKKLFLIYIIGFILLVTIVLYVLALFRSMQKKSKIDLFGNIIMSSILGLQFYSIFNQFLILTNAYNPLIRYQDMLLTSRFQIIVYITLGLGVLLLLYYQFLSDKIKLRLNLSAVYILLILIFVATGSFIGIKESQKKIPLYLSKDVTPYEMGSANGYGYINLTFTDDFYEHISGSNIFSMSGIDVDDLMLTIEFEDINNKNGNFRNGDEFSYKIIINQDAKSVFDVYDENKTLTYEISGLEDYFYDKDTITSQYDYDLIKNTAVTKIEDMSQDYTSSEYYGSDLTYSKGESYRNDGTSRIVFYFLVTDKTIERDCYMVYTATLSAYDESIKSLDFYTNTNEDGLPHNRYHFDTQEEAKEYIESELNSDYYTHDRID